MDMYNSYVEKFVAAVDGIMVASCANCALPGKVRLYYETYKNLLDSLALIPKSAYLDVFISLIIIMAQLIRLILFAQSVRLEINHSGPTTRSRCW